MRPQFPNVIFLFLFPFLSAKKGGKKAEEGKGGGKEGRNKHMVAEREGGKILKLRWNQISVS